MLVLRRHVDQSVVIDGTTTVTVLKVRQDGSVVLGITAPGHITVNRSEVEERARATVGNDSNPQDVTTPQGSGDSPGLGA